MRILVPGCHGHADRAVERTGSVRVAMLFASPKADPVRRGMLTLSVSMAPAHRII